MLSLEIVLGDAGFSLDPEESTITTYLDEEVYYGENTVYWFDEDGGIQVGSFRDWARTQS